MMNGKNRGWMPLICVCLCLSLAGCAGSPSDGERSAAGTEAPASTQISDGTPNHTTNENETRNTESSSMIETMRAVITINGSDYGMTITDTTVGRAFAKKLQDEGSYTVTGSRAADDLCCSESEMLETDSAENIAWVCGGVAWTGDWFTVWVSANPAGYDMPVIAQIDEEHLEELQALSGRMEIEVQLVSE